jgi:hypothetical protein
MRKLLATALLVLMTSPAIAWYEKVHLLLKGILLSAAGSEDFLASIDIPSIGGLRDGLSRQRASHPGCRFV